MINHHSIDRKIVVDDMNYSEENALSMGHKSCLTPNIDMSKRLLNIDSNS